MMKVRYEQYLEHQLGMASTRAKSLYDAMDSLHYSISKMDAHNLRIMWNNFSGLMEAVAQFADHNPGLNDYREWNKPESERIK
tara:strand:+ start:4868 stop:5116 length:249 start_codon:yes stop_codon:yes gene_type:complete